MSNVYRGSLAKGDELSIEVEYMFGKVGTEVVKVVGIFSKGSRRVALLDNGMELSVLPA